MGEANVTVMMNNLTSDDALAITTINHRYLVFDKLGAGSMGIVYRTLDRLTGRFVALKKVNIKVGQSPSVEQNLRLALAHEFQSLASLRHPNIVTVLDYGFAEDNIPYLVMDLLENAKTICEAGTNQPRKTQVNLLVQMLQALSYLHQRGIVHRDLKPKNVLVSDGQLKVLDFGIAISGGQSVGIAGTLRYMAPEVLIGQVAGVSTDLYGVGLIAYELFSGHHPFKESEDVDPDATLKLAQHELIQRIMRIPPETLTASLEAPIAAILNRLLAKKPADRYVSAGQVIEAFNDLLDQPIPYETATIRESFLQTAQLVGREQELALLSAALAQAVAGKGDVWLIGGESGVGKSRLVEELRVRALVQGILVLRGQAVSEGGQPYQIWRDVLRWLCLQSPLTDFEASVLKPLVPDIGTLLGYVIPDAPGLDPQAMQERLVSVIESIFEQQKRPTLIALEDLQWSGSEGIALLARLCRKLTSQPVLIVGNYRDDERASLSPDVPKAQTLKLNRLTQADIAKLSEAMLGAVGQKPAVINFLQRETEGNVFFLIEVVRALARAAGRLDKIGDLTLPETMLTGGVQQFVRQRLSRVPPDASPMLLLAAIAGRDLDLTLLKTLDSQIDLPRWLTICADAGALEAIGERWRFAHDKIREILVTELSTGTRAGLHKQVAQAIETAYPGASEQAVSLTYHWSQVGDTTKTSHYAALAGEQALLNGAYKAAIQFLKQALKHSFENMTLFQAATTQYQLGMAYYGLANLGSSYTHMLEALELLGWEVPTTPSRVIRALIKELVLQIMRPARWLERYSTHPRAVLLLVARICTHLTQIGFFSGSVLSAALYTIRAVNYAEAAGKSPELARSYAHITLALGLVPLNRLAQHYSVRSLNIAKAANQTSTLAYSLYITGFYQSTVGNWTQALTSFQEAVHLLEAIGDKRRWREALANWGYMLGLQGQFAESFKVRATLAEMAERDDDVQARGWGLAGMGEMSLWLHHTDDAIRYLQARIDLMDQFTDVRDPTTPSYAILALTYWRTGQPEKARQAAARGLAHMALLKSSVFHSFHGFASLAEVYLRMWEAQPADKELAAAAAQVTMALRAFSRRFPVYHAWALRNDGMYLWLLGKQSRAHSAWKQSLAAAVRLKMPYDVALVRYEIGRHLPAGNQRQHYLQLAADSFASLGAAYDLDQAKDELSK